MVSIPSLGFVQALPQDELTVKAVTKTWSRDSHGLFDYEATNTKNLTTFAHLRHKIVRKKNDIRVTFDSAEIDLDDRELCRVKIQESKCYLKKTYTPLPIR